MKVKLKKIITVLIVGMFVTINYTNIFAASTDLSLVTDKEKVDLNDEITVVLKANCDTNLSAILAKLEYDKENLTLMREETNNMFKNFSNEEQNYELLINTPQKVTNTDVVTLIFKVNKNASASSTKIHLKDIQITDVTNQKFELEDVSKIITIEKKEEVKKDNDDKDITDDNKENIINEKQDEVLNISNEEKDIKTVPEINKETGDINVRLYLFVIILAAIGTIASIKTTKKSKK